MKQIRLKDGVIDIHSCAECPFRDTTCLCGKKCSFDHFCEPGICEKCPLEDVE